MLTGDNAEIYKQDNSLNKKYQSEINAFRKAFNRYKDKRIVIYGIGRYTATLTEAVKDYLFVGLMDKDPENIGKELFGLPIVDSKTAESIADMVIINTSETYWNVIYERIRDIGLPVYYKNGKKAEIRQYVSEHNPFRELSYERLKLQIENAEVISFDFYDTLFARKVCNPRDVFLLLQKEFETEWSFHLDYRTVRNLAIEKADENYTLRELYSIIEEITGASSEQIDRIYCKEIELEKSLLISRRQAVDAVKHALDLNKEVYIVTDMYLPHSFFKNLLFENDIPVEDQKIVVSSEIKKSKSVGDIWEKLKGTSAVSDRILHTGDNPKADITHPEKYGILTSYTPGVWEMVQSSSLNPICADIVTDYSSLLMGCVLSRLYNDPFSLSKDIRPMINDYKDMGYCIFGPVILTFLVWLQKRKTIDGIGRLIFMSRDGYFLSKAYEVFCKCVGIDAEYEYITISRQLAMTAAIETEEDFEEYLHMPYTGSNKELLEDRFCVKSVKCVKEDTLESLVEKNREEIDFWIRNTRFEYRKYISQYSISEKDAIVDLGFYGNNQKYLCKIADANVRGYYFNANLSDQNPNTLSLDMKACFQKSEDPSAENSQVLKRMIFLESFLTAPTGMAKGIDKDGSFVFAKKGGNQAHFSDKEEIFSGVKELIEDFTKLFGEYELKPDGKFIDRYYGLCFDGSIAYSEEVKRSFYNDNAMMNRIESQLFY